jgi:predicted aldo/keto reductase-like oxidoreductase
MDQEEVLIDRSKVESNSAKLVRRLGRTGFEVNVLGVGGHTYPIGDGPDCFITPEERAILISRLVSFGVNYFDTTDLNEVEVLADSLNRAGIREDVVVSLHGGCISDPQWSEKLRPGIESGLNILGYSRAHLFISNAGDGEASYADIVRACETMMRLKEEKLIQNMGLSCHAINLFPVISKIIRDTGLLDYIMIRFNWKFQRANEELFPLAEEHDVGIVAMKIFCWDCGPSQWERRISVFEPIEGEKLISDGPSLTPAQRNMLWCIQNSPCDVIVPSMNTVREVEENIQALKSIDSYVATDGFEKYSCRLWKKKEIRRLARHAESKMIRERAAFLLNRKPRFRYVLLFLRTIRAHYRILMNEGLSKYLQYSYYYRRGQLTNFLKKIRT